MFDVLLSGTTATIVIQLPKRVYIGWVGDSQVTVWGNGKEKKGPATTEAHRPNVSAE